MTSPVNGNEPTPTRGSGITFAISPQGTLALVVRSGPIQTVLDFGPPDQAEPIVKQMLEHAGNLLADYRQAQRLKNLTLPDPNLQGGIQQLLRGMSGDRGKPAA